MSVMIKLLVISTISSIVAFLQLYLYFISFYDVIILQQEQTTNHKMIYINILLSLKIKNKHNNDIIIYENSTHNIRLLFIIQIRSAAAALSSH